MNKSVKEENNNKIYPNTRNKTFRNNIKPLDIQELMPLINFSYWSTFKEVRRDTATAFASLSANLLLCNTGAIGALLALLDSENEQNDYVTIRNASFALTNLISSDEVKLRIVDSPNGVLSICKLSNLKNIQTLHSFSILISHLTTYPSIRNELVKLGIVPYIMKTIEKKEIECTRLLTNTLKDLSNSPDNKMVLSNLALDQMLDLLDAVSDFEIKRNILQFLCELSVDATVATILIHKQIFDTIYIHLDVSKYNLIIISICLKIIENLSSNTYAQDIIIISELLPLLVDFTVNTILKLPDSAFFKPSPHYMLPPKNSKPLTSYSSRSNKKYLKENSSPNRDQDKFKIKVEKLQLTNVSIASKDEIEKMIISAIRGMFRTFRKISSNVASHLPLISCNLLPKVLSSCYKYNQDKIVKRNLIKILLSFSENDQLKLNHIFLLSSGSIDYLLRSIIYSFSVELFEDVINIIINVINTPECKLPVAQSALLSYFVEYLNSPILSIRYNVTHIFAEISLDKQCEFYLIECNALRPLISLIRLSEDTKVLIEAARAISILSHNPHVKAVIVEMKVIGLLIAIMKKYPGILSIYIKGIIEKMKEEVAALNFQTSFRGFITRKKIEKMLMTKRNSVVRKLSKRFNIHPA